MTRSTDGAAEQHSTKLTPDVDSQDRRATSVEMTGDETIVIHHDYDSPRSRTVELPVGERSINQYTLEETVSTARHGSASSKDHTDRLHFLIRDGDDWTYAIPHAKMGRPNDRDSDYLPTQVKGVKVTTVSKREGGRGHESVTQKRYKINREAVENHDEIIMIQYRTEKGGSANGSYDRVKNEQAYTLTTED